MWEAERREQIVCLENGVDTLARRRSGLTGLCAGERGRGMEDRRESGVEEILSELRRVLPSFPVGLSSACLGSAPAPHSFLSCNLSSASAPAPPSLPSLSHFPQIGPSSGLAARHASTRSSAWICAAVRSSSSTLPSPGHNLVCTLPSRTYKECVRACVCVSVFVCVRARMPWGRVQHVGFELKACMHTCIQIRSIQTRKHTNADTDTHTHKHTPP